MITFLPINIMLFFIFVGTLQHDLVAVDLPQRRAKKIYTANKGVVIQKQTKKSNTAKRHQHDDVPHCEFGGHDDEKAVPQSEGKGKGVRKKGKKSWTKKIKQMFAGIFSKDTPPDDQEVAQQPAFQQESVDVELNKIVEKLEVISEKVPELYALLINNSMDSILNKAEMTLMSLEWASNKKFIDVLNAKMPHERGKASLLLQMKILEAYIDQKMPFKCFVEDLTREKIALEKYETAITELQRSFFWLQENERVVERTEHVLTLIHQGQNNLTTLDNFVLELLEGTQTMLEPEVLRAHKDNSRSEALLHALKVGLSDDQKPSEK